MTDPQQEERMRKLQAIADSLEAGRISPEQADAESERVLLEAQQQVVQRVEKALAARRSAQGRRAILTMAALAIAAAIWWWLSR